KTVNDAPLTTQTFTDFLLGTAEMNANTQALYISAIKGLYIFVSQFVDVNLAALEQAKRLYARKRGQRLINFDKDSIEKVIVYCENMQSKDLGDLRDRAFILTLVDTGLRIHEACNLVRGDIDWKEGRAVIIGKGDKQDIVRFSTRSLNAIHEYLSARQELDGSTGKPLNSLPVFARHGLSAGKGKVRKIQPGGMWLAIKEVMGKVEGVEPKNIRIHDFRHYFVTSLWDSSHNLLAVKTMARHVVNVNTTDRYAQFYGSITNPTLAFYPKLSHRL
ncbi:MAG TPA: site-specific integrase, partial [Syntrophorhabdales bacterium]|nr:site-specific integrase [Syntrophorhabdales bacterium]